ESRAGRLSYVRRQAFFSFSPGLQPGERASIHRCQSFSVIDRDTKIAQESVFKTVDPTVHGEFLTALPGTLNDRRATYVQNLFDDVQLTQTIETLIFIAYVRE